MSKLYKPVTKLSSFGKGLQSDIDNARYISRKHHVCYDESGNTIEKKNIASAARERHAGVQDKSRSSFRVIISLPVEGTADALAEVQAELAERYSSFISAYHDKNDRGEFQPHVHALIFRDMPKRTHPLADRGEIYRLRDRLAERFQEGGIKFHPGSRAGPQPERTQAEEHMISDGREVYKEQFREAVKATLADATSYEDWKTKLQDLGYVVWRETQQSLTLQDLKGRKVRLGRLFGSKLQNKLAVENHITSRRAYEMEKQEQKERRNAEQRQKVVNDGIGGIASQTVHGAGALASAAASEDPARIFMSAATTAASLTVAISKILVTMRSLRTPTLDADTTLSQERKAAEKMYLSLSKLHGNRAGEVYEAAVGNEALTQAVAEQEGCDTEKLKKHLQSTSGEIIQLRHESYIEEAPSGERRTGMDRREGVMDVSGGIGTVSDDTHRPKPEPSAEEVEKLKKEKLALQEQVDEAAKKATTNREFGKMLVGKGISVSVESDHLVISQGSASIEVSGKEIGEQIRKNAELVKAEPSPLAELQRKHNLSLMELLPRLGAKLEAEASGPRITEGGVPQLTPGHDR